MPSRSRADSTKLCSVNPEHGPAEARGWCHICYLRWWKRGGDPAVPAPRNGGTTPAGERLLRHIAKRRGCWIWIGYVAPNGYGYINVGKGIPRRVHRVSYEHFVGPIPDGLTIDHLCANVLCVNPDHLEAVTLQENKRRGGKPHLQETV